MAVLPVEVPRVDSAMRVALVYRNFSLDGSLERDNVLLARSLADRGVEVVCYSNPDTRTVEPHGIAFRDVRPLLRSRSRLGYPIECASFAVAATRALRAERDRYDVVDVRGISAWEHDVVHVHAVPKAEHKRWSTGQGRAYRAPALRSVVAPLHRPQRTVSRTIQRMQFRPGFFRAVIAVTDGVRNDLVREYDVPAEAVEVIPPPIDGASFAAPSASRLRQELELGPTAEFILFVGHAFDRKGLREAIACLPHVREDAHLVVLGRGDETPYERQAASLGVRDRVHFAGTSEKPEAYYGAADLLLLPTRHDPWGIPLIEAMAAGVPVVSTENAGAAEAVRRACAGVIVGETEPAALGAAVSSLLRDPDLRRAMGERGRRAAAEFTADRQAERMIEIYERIAAARRPTARTRGRE
jgi:UDP-glucose:(heptosyl)LPS alpha-1,3-glucosyltransferase